MNATVRVTGLKATCRASARSAARTVVVRAENKLERLVKEVAKPTTLAVIANVIAALPAHAEPGKIFDFNLTGPIMAGQFLLLMVFLDKTWFTPVGAVLDKRDGNLRSKLAMVRDNSGELSKLQKEAEEVLKAARAEAAARIQAAKSKTTAEQNEKLAAAKAKIDKELAGALAALEEERTGALKSLDEQVNKLSDEILRKVLPSGIKM